jgi:hypothetical protein
MTPRGKQLETIRKHYHGLAEVLRGLEVDLRWGLEGSDRIPAEWHRIAAEPQPAKKTHLTIRVDEDVVKFFRATGPGYLTLMNRVLRAYMEARLAGVVKGAEAVDYRPSGLEEYLAGAVEVIELTHKLNVRHRAGETDEALEVEIDRKTAALKVLERELDLPAEMRIIG